MNLALHEFGDGGGEATQWQRRHAARKRAELAKKHRAEAAADKKREIREARADLKKRLAKWRKGYKLKCAAAKAAGRPRPSKKGRPWRTGLEYSQAIEIAAGITAPRKSGPPAPTSSPGRGSQ